MIYTGTFFISITPETSRVVTEGTGVTVPITVTRQGYLKRPASVWVETSAALDADNEGNATPGEDYNPLSTLVTFLPDQASQTIDVTINGDDIPEIIEHLRVSLSGGDCSINGINSVVIGIQDDDEVIISMRDDELTVIEDIEYACVVLYRTGSLSRIDQVRLTVVPKSVPDRSRAATPDADINDNDITVTFDSNEDEQRACVRVYNDTNEETGLESFSVRISEIVRQPGSAGVPATIDDDRRETCVFIRDNDGAFRLNCPSQRVSESVGSVTCTVERTGPATNLEVAYISTSNGDATSLADYEPFSGSRVNFRPGVKSVPFTIKIYDDKDLEGSEDFFVYLAADSGGADLGQSVAIITILDDDNFLTLGSPPGTSTTLDCVLVPESVGSVRLTVYRSAYGSQLPHGITSARVSSREINPGSANVRSPADGNGVDYTDVNTEITFSNGQTRVDVLVQIEDDEVGEPQEAFEVVLLDSTPESNNRISYPSVVTICINDDDGGVDIDDEDDGGAGDDIGGGRVSRSLIVGLGGGLGLLLLVVVLGLIGCVAFSRWSQRTAPPPRRPVTARRVPRAVEPRRVARAVEPQRGYPPPYYAVDPFDADLRQQQGPQSIVIR
ncbi:extracellular matrix protein 3-like [Amphiura filiformis]|uniref:extracellular matrix protein 3-like n=1 Tax=Amphiura filiformis TaxID=82378 RepID=UPI003B2289F4